MDLSIIKNFGSNNLAGFSTDPEFRSAFVAYMEGGTRIALIMSQPGMEVPEKSPMSKGGRKEVKPLSNASMSKINHQK
jgi:hypothetical protein